MSTVSMPMHKPSAFKICAAVHVNVQVNKNLLYEKVGGI